MIPGLKTYSISSTITNFPLADSGGPHTQDEGDRCLRFFPEAGFGGNKRLEPNSLSSTRSEAGTSMSSKSYGGDSECRLGDCRLARGLETTLLILEQKLIVSCLVYLKGEEKSKGKERTKTGQSSRW